MLSIQFRSGMSNSFLVHDATCIQIRCQVKPDQCHHHANRTNWFNAKQKRRKKITLFLTFTSTHFLCVHHHCIKKPRPQRLTNISTVSGTFTQCSIHQSKVDKEAKS